MQPAERLRAVAALARLQPPEAEASAADFDRVVAFAEALLDAPLQPDAPRGAYRAVAERGLADLRADAPAPSLSAEAALRLAPDTRDGCVAVPRTVE